MSADHAWQGWCSRRPVHSWWWLGAAALLLLGPSSAHALAVLDLRWVPSERWLEAPVTRLRAAESRPWGDLPIRARRLELGFALAQRVQLDAELSSWTAGSVRASDLGLDCGLVLGKATVWAGARSETLRVGEMGSRSTLEPRFALGSSHAHLAWVLRWDPPAGAGPAEAWSVGARISLRSASLAIERQPDRFGTGPVWHRSLRMEFTDRLRLALAWSADDLRTLLELRTERWTLRVGTVIDGPRTGAQAVEIGWSP